MRDETLKGRKMDAYVLLKILKYCTDSPARSYQLKFAINDEFFNKSLDRIDNWGTAIEEIIYYKTIRGKFSSVHPDLAAEGITRVEVGQEGLHFVTNKGKLQSNWKRKPLHSSDVRDQGLGCDTPESENEKEMLNRAIAMSLEV